MAKGQPTATISTGQDIPPLPPGFVLDQPQDSGSQTLPPLPPGFVLDRPPPIPDGFTLDQPQQPQASAPQNLPPLPPGFTLDAPQEAPKQSTPDTSNAGHDLGSALASGFESAKGDLEQGLADVETAGQKYLGHGLIGKIETNPKEAAVNFLLGPFSPYADTKNTADPDAALTPALERGAQAARTSAAQTYQPDASTPTSAADAIANSSGPLSAAARLGKYALYQGAQAAPTLGANLLMTAAAPESTLARIGLVGLNRLRKITSDGR